MDKIVLLDNYQKEKLKKYSLDNQLEIAPLGVFLRKKILMKKLI